MADRSDESLLREIDEEIRQEKYEQLWKKYGTHIIAAAILLVISVAAVQGWKTWDRNNRESQTAKLYQAIAAAKSNAPSAVDQTSQLASQGTGGAALLASLQKAALLADNGDTQQAADLYRSIADGDAPKTYAHLALIKGASLEIDMMPAPADLGQRLGTLTSTENPWRHAAQELLGLLALKDGDNAKANGIFKSLTEDATTPAGIRARANQLADSIGG